MDNSYKEYEEQPQVVNEPVAAYGMKECSAGNALHSVPQEITHLPDEILIAAIKYAQKAREEGRTIPHEEVYYRLAQRFGWE